MDAGGIERVMRIESVLGEECRGETVPDGDLEVNPRERFDDRYIRVHGPARFRSPQVRHPAGGTLKLISV